MPSRVRGSIGVTSQATGIPARGGRPMSRYIGRPTLLLCAVAVLSLAFAAPASAEKYIVLYKSSSVPADASRTIERAGGRVVASYGQIGVVVADSDAASFRDAVMRDGRVEGAEGTSRYAAQVRPVEAASHDEQPPELPNAPAGQDPLFPLQWDMRQIDTPRAHAVTGGSPAVITGIIDTGVDKDHPDLLQNIDFAKSASCESGAPNPNPVAWDDRHGHGTHTAGTTAAPHNGFGITGVAPNTKIAAIKSSTDAGFFFPEMVVCSFMWAGSQHLDVTNNSYFADPFLYNCRNDPTQHAIWKAEQRAIRYAQQQGVADVTAPGGDSLQITAEAPNGRVLSTWPAEIPCARAVQDPPPPPEPTAVYCYLQGTSMAGPHVAGVAALVVSRFGDLDNPQNGKMRPGAVQQYVEKTADPQPCPTEAEMAFYAPFPRPGGEPQQCQGGEGYNSWYGHGEANAFRAVTHDTSNR